MSASGDSRCQILKNVKVNFFLVTCEVLSLTHNYISCCLIQGFPFPIFGCMSQYEYIRACWLLLIWSLLPLFHGNNIIKATPRRKQRRYLNSPPPRVSVRSSSTRFYVYQEVVVLEKLYFEHLQPIRQKQ